MPILQRRSDLLSHGESPSLRNSSDSGDTLREHVVIVGNDYEKPHKEMDFPSAQIVNATNAKMKNTLHINTYSRSELHDRYMSSEVSHFLYANTSADRSVQTHSSMS